MLGVSPSQDQADDECVSIPFTIMSRLFPVPTTNECTMRVCAPCVCVCAMFVCASCVCALCVRVRAMHARHACAPCVCVCAMCVCAMAKLGLLNNFLGSPLISLILCIKILGQTKLESSQVACLGIQVCVRDSRLNHSNCPM